VVLPSSPTRNHARGARRLAHSRADGRLAASDLARAPSTRDEPASGRRLPGLVGLLLSGPCLRWWSGLRRCHGFLRSSLGARGAGLRLVFRQAAVFVFASRPAMTGLVAPWACTGLNSHRHECTGNRAPLVSCGRYLPAMTTVSGVGSGCAVARPKPAAVSIC
jgi:hypothetical protein